MIDWLQNCNANWNHIAPFLVADVVSVVVKVVVVHCFTDVIVISIVIVVTAIAFLSKFFGAAKNISSHCFWL